MYALELVKKFGLENAKESKNPMSTTCKLDKDEEGTSVDQRLYKSLIESLLYLTTIRPNIMLSVCLCMSSTLTTLDYGIPNKLALIFMSTPIWTFPDQRMIEKY